MSRQGFRILENYDWFRDISTHLKLVQTFSTGKETALCWLLQWITDQIWRIFTIFLTNNVRTEVSWSVHTWLLCIIIDPC